MLILLIFIGLLAGLGFGWLIYRMNQNAIHKRATLEAADLLAEAKDQAELRLLDEKEKTQEIEQDLWARDDVFFQKIESHIEELEELGKELKEKHDNQVNKLKNRNQDYENQLRKLENQNEQHLKNIDGKRAEFKTLQEKYVNLLSSRSSHTKESVLENLRRQLIEESERISSERLQLTEEDFKENAELKAKEIIDKALARFQRPFSAERGIPPVYFEFPEQRKILCDPAGENIKAIQDLTGCDIIIEDDMDLVGIAGFDPVRRELCRRLIERCLKERKPVGTEFIKRTGENIKKELLSSIRRDGDQMARELKLENLHPEVRQMMGSLRYRYSFTQNQYFHCGEVGWLCGLLASELGGIEVTKARRSGMLHDLGKSMDHELEGGHAVIGADFIEKRNEAADIVHAVRAHHFDVQPTANMDFLVIGADAISGGRPGARRSTMESYTQKITELESIARSFEGVTDCFILSGGRECRVLVNSRVVDDLRALKLSKEIATRIENECNYPGQIRVVVVRETMGVETTR